MCSKWDGFSLLLDAERSRLSLDAVCSRLSLNVVRFDIIAQRREKTLELNIRSWAWPVRLLTLFLIKNSENGNETVETLTPEPTTPATIDK